MTMRNNDFSSLTSMASGADYRTTANPSASAAQTKFRYGLSTMAKRYDTFLIDQWGVLHDGQKPYVGAVECLRRLTWSGKQVIIISNSGKRAAANESRLKKIGFPRDSYSQVVTSGEITWQMLATGGGVFRKFVGKRCLLLSSEDASEFAAGLSIRLVDSVEEADFILLAGIDDSKPQNYYDYIIATGLSRGIQLICTNPDLTRITSDGLKPGSGAMAKNYQARGGRVHYIGKPHPEIYSHCLMLAATRSEGRAIAIGDSLHHDIAGGIAAGIDTLLVIGGVHSKAFEGISRSANPMDVISKITADPDTVPNWAVPFFRW